MPESASTPPPIAPAEEGGLACLLVHADRCWKAEEVNAARIGARSNLVLTGVTAVLGLKLYGASAEIRGVLQAEYTGYVSMFWWTAVLGLIGMLACLALVLEVKIAWLWVETESLQTATGKAPACAKLYFPEKLKHFPSNPESIPKRLAETTVFQNTYAAALQLNARNDKRNRSVSMAQLLFFVSAVLLFISLACYSQIVYHEAQPDTQNRHHSAP